MSSWWTIITFFCHEIPILWLDASNASTFKLIRGLFRTDTSILVIAEYMSILAFHALSSFSYPEVWRIALNTNIICCQIGWLGWTFAFSFLDVVNKCIRACFTFHADIIPEVWSITWNTNVILTIWLERWTLTFFSLVVVNLWFRTNDTDHTGSVIMGILWACITLMVFKKWSVLWAWSTNAFNTIVNLLIWTL